MKGAPEKADDSRRDAGTPQQQPAEPTPKIRVAWIAGNETLETFGRALNPLAIGLMDELVELLVVCPVEADFGVLPSPPMQVLRHGRLNMWLFDTGAVESLTVDLKARKVQLLHALDGGCVRLARKLAGRLGVRYVASTYALGGRRRLGALDDRAAAVLPGSKPLQSDLLARRVATADRVQLVRPGVYHVRHAACFSDPNNSISIVASGRLDDFAAFGAVLRSFAELRDRRYDCVFFVIGNGPAEKRLRARARKLNLRQELTFVDGQSPWQMPGIFQAADLFVSPTTSRTVDMSALLAMAGGVPVLAATDGPCDFLIDGQTAMLFEQGDSAELTVKLASLLDDKAAARALAQRALSYVREHHSPADMVAAVTRVYRQAVR